MKPQRFTLTAVVTRYVFSEKVLIRYLPCTRYTVSNQHLAAEEPDISEQSCKSSDYWTLDL